MPAAASGVSISDVILGDTSAGAFRPVARVRSSTESLAIRVEARATSPAVLEDLTIATRVEKVGEPGAGDVVDLSFAATDDPLRRVASSALRLLAYTPGEYILTVTVTAGGRTLARRTRAFRK